MSKIHKTKSSPNELDKHLGEKLRFYRTLRNISQNSLAQSLDLSFQQIQKYEKGTNRISASRLYKISKILDVSLLSFFNDYEEDKLLDKK